MNIITSKADKYYMQSINFPFLKGIYVIHPIVTGKDRIMRNKPGIGSSNLLGIAFLFPLLLASCAAAPQRMTEAALVGDSAALDDLLRAGAGDVNLAYVFGKNQTACPGETILTPLQAASCAGHAAIVEKLLDAKAVPDLPTSQGKTPLFLAVSNGRDDVARLLVERGAKLTSRTPTEIRRSSSP